MLTLFVILIVLCSLILGLIVLVQNPKGGGLSGTFGGVGNQIMGVKQTTDVLEKGTWIFFGLVALLCILSPIFIPNSQNSGKENKFNDILNPTEKPAKSTTPANTVPLKP